MLHTLLGLALAILFGCGLLTSGSQALVPFRVLLQSGRFFKAYDANTEVPAAFAAFRSEAEEEAFLTEYSREPYWTGSGGGPFFPPFPDVDYSSETAVVIALGTQGSGSISVRLDSVVVEGGQSVVYATSVIPCVQTRDIANPAIVAAIEGEGREVMFAPLAVERDDRPCQ